jgi:integrase
LERIALDAFSLSFLTMGANLADLYRAKPFKGDVWSYNRKKTETVRPDGAPMNVTIQPEALPYIERLQRRGGKAWWLPALHAIAKDSNACTRLLNKSLRSWTERNGLPRFTFYAARHTWATLARRLGVEKATVDECLCHKGDFDLTDIYAERAWNLMTEANRKVLDYITNR